VISLWIRRAYCSPILPPAWYKLMVSFAFLCSFAVYVYTPKHCSLIFAALKFYKIHMYIYEISCSFFCLTF
jgi:hypothetical protein